jgi:hypothetical protein
LQNGGIAERRLVSMFPFCVVSLFKADVFLCHGLDTQTQMQYSRWMQLPRFQSRSKIEWGLAHGLQLSPGRFVDLLPKQESAPALDWSKLTRESAKLPHDVGPVFSVDDAPSLPASPSTRAHCYMESP